ncbi:MAG: NADP-dependent isocitrate dehydrogenase, partial [Planctomycetota bacterium]
HPGMDVVIVRENEEDTYGGIEHQQTAEVTQCLKLITRPGCEKIVRHAFEYAVKNGRKRVSCFTKDNIMKATDGLFHKVFNEIAPQYPDIETDHWIIDIGAARLADTPEMFDVIVTPNLYGDILSDIAAQVAGSVGLVGTANIGPSVSMFEAIHGSAPDIAGMDIANPTALILASVQMLIHIGKPDVAERVHNAWLATIEDGVHTRDVFNPGHTRELVGTQGFADAVIARLGRQPESLPTVNYTDLESDTALVEESSQAQEHHRPEKALVGVDLFMDWGGDRDPSERNPDELAEQLRALEPHCGLKLQMITNRGVKVWPQGMPETFCTDHWRCRFVGADDLTHPTASVTPLQIVHLQQAAAEHGLDFIKTEHLCTFDGTPGFSLGQGQ